ncbi:MAG TPA: glycosyltransferase family 2 protein [Chitinophagaceae bacterium]|nr:glycosyltransferase family 2 protein [Chitinophagaceae bacterium]
METCIKLTHTSRHGFKVSEVKADAVTHRALIRKKFVDWKILTLVFIFSLLYLIFHTLHIRDKPIYLIVFAEALMFFLVWNKVYQIFYDLKLLFFFNNEYDVNLEFPRGKDYPAISFVIASYQEPFKVAKMTFDSVVNAPYKGRKEIIVVDNSRDVLSDDFIKWKKYVEEFTTLHPSQNISARFVYNHRRDTLKPGNLDLAEQFIKEGEFVVILDVDSTLPANAELLERAVTEFMLDGKLGFLQFSMKATNYHFNNLTQSVAASQDLHRLRLTSRSYGGYKIFEGHNGMWRKSVLEKVGNWTDYYKGNIMITEDILKSAQVYSNGYYGKSLHIMTGEWIPSSLNALESMWMRWTYGTSQVLFKYFNEIYSKRISLLEKFDISYHVLHHFAHGFIIPMAILLQLIMPGPLSTIFIVAVYILPQLIGAITIYFKSINRLEIPFLRKLGYIYGGYFLVDTFIMSTQLKSSINFLSGIPQGWKVTEKGIENSLAWKDLLLNKSFHILIACVAIAVCIISWFINYDMEPAKLIHFSVLVFMAVNLVLSVVIFGKAGRKGHNDVESAIIDAIGEGNDSERRLLAAIEIEELNNPELQESKIDSYTYH